MTRVGLVLGGGGATGAAFHAGTLLAMEHDLGWSPDRADVIVGTSAGSLVGALVRAGLSTEDLGAWASGVAPSEGGRELRRLIEQMAAVPARLRPGLRWQRLNLRLVGRAFGSVNRRTVPYSLLPHGIVDISAAFRMLDAAADSWPARSLWVTAVRIADGRRVVFGRDVTPPLGHAVAASCAVPLLYRPVVVEGVRYHDGGVHSPTNADVLARCRLDVVIVLSPMSSHRRPAAFRPHELLRARFARRLDGERRRLEAAGTEVIVIEPDDATLLAMGVNALDRKRIAPVMTQSFLGASTHYSDELKRALRRSPAAA